MSLKWTLAPLWGALDVGPCSSETQTGTRSWCSIIWLDFDNGLQGTPRIRMQSLLSVGGLKRALIPVNAAQQQGFFLLGMGILSVE